MSGTKGKRYALPNSRIMIHQPLLGGQGLSGQATDIRIESAELVKTKQRLTEIMAKHTGQPVDKIMADMERNYYLSAEKAKDYGILDEVISPRKLQDLAKK